MFKIELNSCKYEHILEQTFYYNTLFLYLTKKLSLSKQQISCLHGYPVWFPHLKFYMFAYVSFCFFIYCYIPRIDIFWGSVFVGFWPWLKNTTTIQQSKKWGLSWKYNVYDWKVDDATWICFVIVFSIGLLVNWLWFIVFLVNWLLAMLVFQFWVKFG